jgi:hypothetical protein
LQQKYPERINIWLLKINLFFQICSRHTLKPTVLTFSTIVFKKYLPAAPLSRTPVVLYDQLFPRVALPLAPVIRIDVTLTLVESAQLISISHN